MKAVILAGGHGTRLYPLSTKERPKQFVNLIGDKTLYQQTVDRLAFLNPEDIYVATNRDYVPLVKKQSPDIPPENIIEEPAMRNTASCIGYAASQIQKKHPDEVMAVIYADHLVRDNDEFAKKLQIASKIAKTKDTLNIIEVEALSPNTNLGWVKIGNLDEEIDGVKVYYFKEFKEKPDLITAQKYLEQGNYLWNTGFYVWKISTILEKFKKFQPQTYKIFMKIAEDPELLHKLYPQLDNISIDYAIMEMVDPKDVRIIPAKLGWSDIGTFDSLYKELEKSGEHEKIQKFKQLQHNGNTD